MRAFFPRLLVVSLIAGVYAHALPLHAALKDRQRHGLSFEERRELQRKHEEMEAVREKSMLHAEEERKRRVCLCLSLCLSLCLPACLRLSFTGFHVPLSCLPLCVGLVLGTCQDGVD